MSAQLAGSRADCNLTSCPMSAVAAQGPVSIPGWRCLSDQPQAVLSPEMQRWPPAQLQYISKSNTKSSPEWDILDANSVYDDLAAVQSVALILHGFERCGLRDERLFSGLAAASKEMRFYDVQAVASVIGSFSYVGYEDQELYEHLVSSFMTLTSGRQPVFLSPVSCRSSRNRMLQSHCLQASLRRSTYIFANTEVGRVRRAESGHDPGGGCQAQLPLD
eukprot:641282-Rhodomonas_salina.2